MANENPLTLRQADQVRTDFAAIESDLEFLMQQIARLARRAMMDAWARFCTTAPAVGDKVVLFAEAK
jgi:hypothetical protein